MIGEGRKDSGGVCPGRSAQGRYPENVGNMVNYASDLWQARKIIGFVPGIILVTFYLAACIPGSNLDSKCEPPPSEILASDLAGTWTKKKLDLRTDTLVIREDGTYQQTIHLSPDGRDYQSDWLPWYLEYEDGIPYLHMVGLALCAYIPEIECEAISTEYTLFDFCKKHSVKVPAGEGILIVLPPAGGPETQWGDVVNLWSLQVSDLRSWVYAPQED